MFIDLVAVSFPLDKRNYLYEAPRWTGLEQGDEVIVQDDDGRHSGIVLDSVTVTKDDDKYNFIVNAMGAEKPLARVIQKVTYHKLDWKEDEE